jgi:hypothetical protein
MRSEYSELQEIKDELEKRAPLIRWRIRKDDDDDLFYVSGSIMVSGQILSFQRASDMLILRQRKDFYIDYLMHVITRSFAKAIMDWRPTVKASKEIWDYLEDWEWESLTSDMQEYVLALGREKHKFRNLLSEWLHEGRFLVANCEEYNDLVARTKEALGR